LEDLSLYVDMRTSVGFSPGGWTGAENEAEEAEDRG
jgi:hypothetical protein